MKRNNRKAQGGFINKNSEGKERSQEPTKYLWILNLRICTLVTLGSEYNSSRGIIQTNIPEIQSKSQQQQQNEYPFLKSIESGLKTIDSGLASTENGWWIKKVIVLLKGGGRKLLSYKETIKMKEEFKMKGDLSYKI